MSVQAAASAPSLPTEVDARTRGLLEAPLLRTLLKLAAPNAVVMVAQISIPLVEIYFIAKISIDALAGVSAHGIAALAGYGAGSRIEFMLVSLSYGIGGPAGILIGTNIGAGNTDRALRVAWMGTLIAVLTAEVIGLAVAFWPVVWLAAFSRDPSVIAVGSEYLRTVGPFFGFFGMGYALYCAGQGTGRMGWPATGALVRAAIAVTGGALVLRVGVGLAGIFLAAGVGMAAFGCLSVLGLILRVGFARRNGSRAVTGPHATEGSKASAPSVSPGAPIRESQRKAKF
jgi:Na+-driven multidrug efflux pump